MRVPRSAQTLEAQVSDRYKKVTVEPYGDPDGLGVYRSVRFGKTESKWLAKVLPEIDDPRITEVEEKSGRVIVTFASGTSADQRHPFPLDAADTVASASDD